jgi:hypothetical protein
VRGFRSPSSSPPPPRTELRDIHCRRESTGPELLAKLDDDVPAARRRCCGESSGEGAFDARHRRESRRCTMHLAWHNVGQLSRTYVNSRRLIRARVHVSPRRYAISLDSIPGAATDCRARESGPARSPVIATGVLRPGARGHGRRTRPSDTRGRFPARPPIAEPTQVLPSKCRLKTADRITGHYPLPSQGVPVASISTHPNPKQVPQVIFTNMVPLPAHEGQLAASGGRGGISNDISGNLRAACVRAAVRQRSSATGAIDCVSGSK